MKTVYLNEDIVAIVCADLRGVFLSPEHEIGYGHDDHPFSFSTGCVVCKRGPSSSSRRASLVYERGKIVPPQLPPKPRDMPRNPAK